MVRADPRSGRLVRRVVVTARPVPSRPVGSAAYQRAGAPSENIQQIVAEAAREHAVDPLLVHSMIEVESNYNPYAVSPKGAEGLMQLMPATARRFGVRNSFNPRQNIEGGIRYLKYLSGLFPQDLRLVLAAYNAGEAAVARYNGIPRYPETENYVYQVGKRYGQHRKRQTFGVALHAGDPATSYRPLKTFIDGEGRLHMRTQ